MDPTSKDKRKSAERRIQLAPKIPKDKTILNRIEIHVSQPVAGSKGPNVVNRALHEDFEIERKSGEGSRPLFEREGVIANAIDDNKIGVEDGFIKESAKKDTSSSQSSYRQPPVDIPKKPVEYRHRGCCGKLPIPKTSDKSANENRTTPPRKPKVPYYRDEVRERDRLQRLYGDSRRHKSRLLSPPCSSKDRSRRRRRSTSRDDHRDYSSRNRTRSDSNKGHSSRRPRSRTQSPHRESSRRNQHSRHSRDSHSPCCSHTRQLNSERRSHRSHSSPSKHATSSSGREDERETRNEDLQETMHVPTNPMFIPVPVPIADYAYSFPHWRVSQNPWAPHMPHRAPVDPFGFSMVPMIPPIRAMHPIRYTGAPPPMPYAPMSVTSFRPRPAYRFPHPKQSNK